MDDFTAEILATGQDNTSQPSSSPERKRDDRTSRPPSIVGTPPQKSGLRGGIAALREKASIQDRLVEKSVMN